jgi:hypothetical protein
MLFDFISYLTYLGSAKFKFREKHDGLNLFENIMKIRIY